MKKIFRIQFFPKKSRFNFSRKNPDLIFPEKNSRNFPGKITWGKEKKNWKKISIIFPKKNQYIFRENQQFSWEKGKNEKKKSP